MMPARFVLTGLTLTSVRVLTACVLQLHCADQRAARAQRRAVQEERRELAGLTHGLHLLLGGAEQEQPGGAAAQQGAGGECASTVNAGQALAPSEATMIMCGVWTRVQRAAEVAPTSTPGALRQR
jgi:hypothetical protein